VLDLGSGSGSTSHSSFARVVSVVAVLEMICRRIERTVSLGPLVSAAQIELPSSARIAFPWVDLVAKTDHSNQPKFGRRRFAEAGSSETRSASLAVRIVHPRSE
jgi:hypothetical protein